MGALSVAAEMAWKVAAAEAARGRHPQIDNALLLVGLCSLEKLLSAQDERALAPEAGAAVRREADRVEAALARAGLEATPLRRILRDRLGRATYEHGERPVSRSAACKETFYRAALLAGGTEVTCLHLLAALAQDPDPAVSRPLRELGASLETLKEQALLIAREAPVPAGDKREDAPRDAAADNGTPHLDRFGRDLTALAAKGELPPVIGRRARGDLRLIGATTLAEYRRHVESDPGLERRFEKVHVDEPTREEALEILRGLAPGWEKHHQVGIDDEALQAAVDLSLRFDHDHRLPDKAIDLVDKATARTRVPRLSMAAPPYAPPEGRAPAFVDRVTEHTVAQVLAEKMNVPVELVADVLPGGGRPRVLDLEAHLRARIVGQDEALARVCRRLRLAHAGTRDLKRPLAVLLFLGPTGVGKTETARLVASFLFGGPEALARFDMSEYMEEHSVARLIGAPPGYVGHEEEGQLGARLRTRPYGVVLLDEVEKAHPGVFDVFLQVFDAGRLTDGRGRTADARHSIFILTSNLGTAGARERPVFGAGDGAEERGEAAALEEVRRFFRPELLNRIDEQVLFRPLGPEDAVRIVKPLLEEFVDTVRRQHGVALTVEPAAEAFIAQAGFDPARGVREVRRAVERLVQAPLSNLILEGKISKHPAWTVAYDEGGVYVIPAPRG